LKFLLDTNVISELIRTKPDENVLSWVNSLPSEAFYLSVLSLGEIRKGVEKLAAGDKKHRLVHWLEQDLPDWFEDRVIAADTVVADQWGVLAAGAGRSVPAIDSLLAASAMTHGLTLATRNVKDFAFPGLNVIDPWRPETR